MLRKRTTPPLYRYSRYIMAGIGTIGTIITSYLTYEALTGGKVACPTDPTAVVASCDIILTSAYAKLFGLPLSLFGLIAYITMIGLALAPTFINAELNKTLRKSLEETTGLLLLIGGTSMTFFSSYLMYIAFGVLKATCLYCIGSAICSLLLFIFAIIGRDWEDMGQVFFTSLIVALITLVGTLALYNNVNRITKEGIPIPEAQGKPTPPHGWEITTKSGPAELALAQHLKQSGVTMYGAFWCPHCYEQKQLFGRDAFAEIPYVECDPAGNNPQPQLCIDKKIPGYPSWEINGKIESSVMLLKDLATKTNYQGPQTFQYRMPNQE